MIRRSFIRAWRPVIGMCMAICFCAAGTQAQDILNKQVSLEVKRQRLDNVLEILSNRGNFYFSYNSAIIKKDSLVSLSVSNKTIRQVLGMLFNDSYEFVESGSYIIIRKIPVKLSLVTSQAYSNDKAYIVSGYVLDESSGERLSDASVYEKNRLLSTLTNEQGYFEIRLKSRAVTTALTVSKQSYQDTTIVIQPKYNQQIRVAIVPVELNSRMVTVSPNDYLTRDSIIIQVDSIITTYHYLRNDSVKVERTMVGRMLLSSKQKIQSLNLRKFFTERPFQLSLLPGISTHGWLNAQVVNKVSLNVLGGYSAGVNGVEAAGWFNIDKQSVRWLQLAGWFNIVGGSVTGLQAAGIHNLVIDSVKGVQYAGISNFVKRKFTGLQGAGIYNHVGDSLRGAQLAGIANFTRRHVSGFQGAGIYNHAGDSVMGVQMAGIANYSGGELRGLQAAGIINYTRKLKGLQLGLINIADTSEGYSIGLINIVVKGMHRLVFSTNEVTNTNVAFKTGNKKLYSILEAGMQVGTGDKLYTFGYGIGKECSLGRKWSISPEISARQLYLGSWHYTNLLSRFDLNVNLRLGKSIAISAGPAFSVYYSDQPAAINGYKYDIGYNRFSMGNRVKGWFGWNMSIDLL